MPRPDARPAFHTLGEVAALCAVSVRTARRWIARGELVAHRFGRQWRIAADDLTTFVRLRRLG